MAKIKYHTPEQAEADRKKQPGTPKIYPKTPELVADILTHVAAGRSLVNIGKMPGFPNHGVILKWIGEDEGIADAYARAKDAAADNLAEEIIDLADEQPPLVDGKMDSGWVQWQRNRVEARKWIAAKLKPKKYGDRVNVDAEVKTTQLDEREINAKISAILAKGAIDVIPSES